MTALPTMSISDLYLADETAWLEVMADAVAAGQWDGIDRENLQEYLTSMANRDRRELRSRLIVLLAHILKWEHQPAKRSRSWRLTIGLMNSDIEFDIQGGTLRNHAVAVLGDAYIQAVARAAQETKLPKSTFPSECPFDLPGLLDWHPGPEADDESAD